MHKALWVVPFCALSLAGSPPAAAQDERVILGRAEILRWEFATGADGWSPALQAEARESPAGVLRLHSRGDDPAVVGPPVAIDASEHGHVFRVRMKVAAGTSARLFWADDAKPDFDESRAANLEIIPDGAFHDYELSLLDRPGWTGRITHLRFDPTVAAGEIEIDRLALDEVRRHPLSLGPGVQEEQADGSVRVRHRVTNHSLQPQRLAIRAQAPDRMQVAGLAASLSLTPRQGDADLTYTLRPSEPGFFPVTLEADGGGPILRREVVIRRYPERDAQSVAMAWDARNGNSVGRWDGGLLFYAGTARRPVAALELVGRATVETSEGTRLTEVQTGDPREPNLVASGSALWMSADGAVAGVLGSTARTPALVNKLALPLVGTVAAKRSLRIRNVEWMVLRLPGRSHDQALLGGLEFLGKDEPSSSDLDLETLERWRTIPDPLKLTMPLMGVVKDGVAIGLAWDLPPGTPADRRILQPSFAVPNFVDGEPNHRLSLMLPAVRQGRTENRWEAGQPVELEAGESLTLAATLYVIPAGDVGSLIETWLKDHPFPPPPPALRGDAAAWGLIRRGYLDSELYDPEKKGWGHCAEKSWDRHPFADHLGYLWKLGLIAGGGGAGGREAARVREVLAAHPGAANAPGGGAHIRTRLMPFTLGDPLACLAREKAQAEALMRQQRPDGLWTYEGKYRRGHFEDTASGFCAPKALAILDYAKASLDPQARAAGLKALAAMNRFRTPRGAQTWELSLHTPDLLASAHLTGAYVRGWELTKDPALLDRARYWARTGVPFVYLWDRTDLPVMRYSTIAVYGATNWVAPNWIGLPVQWCGQVYARHLLDLARHDRTADWRRLAEGITVASEQMLNPDGPHAGCLPDSFNLARQYRNGPMINPGATAALKLMLAGDRADAETDLARWKGAPVAVTTVARDVAIDETGDGALRLRGRFHAGAAYCWVLAGVPAPAAVTANGAPVPRADAWPKEGPVWRAADGWVAVRVAPAGEADEVRLK